MAVLNLKRNHIENLSLEVPQGYWGWLVVYGASLITLGAVALALPVLTTFVVEAIVGAVFGVAAFATAVQSFKTTGFGNVLWHLVQSAIYGAVAFTLFRFPLEGAVTLTLLMGAFFLVQGVIRGLMALDLRQERGWGWLLASAFVSLAMGAVVLGGLPESAIWVLGLIVGADLILLGIAFLVMGLALRVQGQRHRLEVISVGKYYNIYL